MSSDVDALFYAVKHVDRLAGFYASGKEKITVANAPSVATVFFSVLRRKSIFVLFYTVSFERVTFKRNKFSSIT